MDLKKFFSELKRREVYKVAIAYGITTWLIAQISGLISTSFEFPPWVMQMIISILIIGFPIALILSWIFEFSSKGIRKTGPIASDANEQNKTMETKLVIGILVLISLLMIGGWWTWQELVVNNTKPIKSLAVLPFDNYTGNDELEYFVAGMHSSLIGDIQKISALRVPGTTSSNSFKGDKMSIPEIASALNVDALIEASVYCIEGDSVCIQIRLVRVYPEEQQLWVQDYYEDKSQILNLYNRVTKQISKEINIVLTPQEESLLAVTRTVDPEAYDAYLKGHYYYDDGSEESMQKALKYLNSAIEKESDWAPLYSALAQVWMILAQGHVPPEIAGPKIYENIGKALDLDPDLADAHFVNGMMAYLAEWNWDKGEKELLKALAINPNDALSRIFYAQLLSILQRPEEALTQGRLALDLDPLNPLIQALYAALILCLGDCETALVHLEKVVAIDPEHFLANSNIELAAFHCGDYDKVFEAAKYSLPIEEDTFKKIEMIFNEQGFIAAYEEILRQLEVMAHNDFVVPVEMAYRYIMVNQPDKAMEWIEKGYELHDPNMPYIATGVYLCEPLFNNPRFIDIVEKMNLPMPENYQTTKNNRN